MTSWTTAAPRVRALGGPSRPTPHRPARSGAQRPQPPHAAPPQAAHHWAFHTAQSCSVHVEPDAAPLPLPPPLRCWSWLVAAMTMTTMEKDDGDKDHDNNGDIDRVGIFTCFARFCVRVFPWLIRSSYRVVQQNH